MNTNQLCHKFLCRSNLLTRRFSWQHWRKHGSNTLRKMKETSDCPSTILSINNIATNCKDWKHIMNDSSGIYSSGLAERTTCSPPKHQLRAKEDDQNRVSYLHIDKKDFIFVSSRIVGLCSPNEILLSTTACHLILFTLDPALCFYGAFLVD